MDGVGFVMREIMAGPRPQHQQKFVQFAPVRFVQDRLRPGEIFARATEGGDDFFAQFPGRRDLVGETGVDDTSRHAIKFRRFGRLHKHPPGFLPDRPGAGGAVRPHAGENHGEAVFSEILGQRSEEKIDRQPESPVFVLLQQSQHAVPDRQVMIGRNHKDVIRLEAHAVADHPHRHRRGVLQQLGEMILMGRIEVLHHHEGHSRVAGQAPKEVFERLQPAGRGADSHNARLRNRDRGQFAGIVIRAASVCDADAHSTPLPVTKSVCGLRRLMMRDKNSREIAEFRPRQRRVDFVLHPSRQRGMLTDVSTQELTSDGLYQCSKQLQVTCCLNITESPMGGAQMR